MTPILEPLVAEAYSETVDLFATAALQGLIAEPDPRSTDDTSCSTLRVLTDDLPDATELADRFAIAAYRLADAMMRERSRNRTEGDDEA